MKHSVSDIAFTPAVKAQQTRLGSRDAYARMDEKGGWADSVTEDLAQFIGERDSVYLSTASAAGQPSRSGMARASAARLGFQRSDPINSAGSTASCRCSKEPCSPAVNGCRQRNAPTFQGASAIHPIAQLPGPLKRPVVANSSIGW